VVEGGGAAVLGGPGSCRPRGAGGPANGDAPHTRSLSAVLYCGGGTDFAPPLGVGYRKKEAIGGLDSDAKEKICRRKAETAHETKRSRAGGGPAEGRSRGIFFQLVRRFVWIEELFPSEKLMDRLEGFYRARGFIRSSADFLHSERGRGGQPTGGHHGFLRPSFREGNPSGTQGGIGGGPLRKKKPPLRP